MQNNDWVENSKFIILHSTFGKLSLRELESRTGTLLPVFLAFLLTRITCDKSCFFKCRTQIGVEFHQGTRNAVTDGTGLSGRPAAVHIHQDVEFAGRVRKPKRLANDHL